MAVPTTYLTSTKNLPSILDAIRKAQAPKTFSVRFLQGLGFKSSSDRLVIGVLKSLGFLDQGGRPTDRYFRFLDESQSKRVLAEGIRDAYGDLFELNKDAHEMTRSDLKNKLKTLSQGQYSDAVLDKMAATFRALSDLGDFTAAPSGVRQAEPRGSVMAEAEDAGQAADEVHVSRLPGEMSPLLPIQGLVYNIELHLPESRDPAVYDALFRSLREHLFA